MSKHSTHKIFHSVPVLGEDLSVGFRTETPTDIVFIPPQNQPVKTKTFDSEHSRGLRTSAA